MWEAWEKVRPVLEGNPDELKARLARRRSRMYLRPLRAFCLAVRASDRRMTPGNTIMVPEDGAWPGRVDLWREHEVTLDKRLLVELCRPVTLRPPGELVEDVARLLGMDPCSLAYLRKNGTLEVHYVKGLCGRRGKPVPLVYTPEMLDPSAWGKGRPDPIWGGLWMYHAEWLPDDFEQAVARAPEWREFGGRGGMANSEHRTAKIERRAAEGERPTSSAQRPTSNGGGSALADPSPQPSPPSTGARERRQIVGWRWVCPGCKRLVKTVYLPLRVPDWGKYVGFKCGDEVDEVPGANACFACMACHGVIMFTRSALTWSWNQLVLHYTGGLMYGREVRRPAWLRPGRKRAYRARGRKNGAPRREELERLLWETDLSYAEMAREMGVKRATVGREVCRIYRRLGVHGREEYREAAGKRLGFGVQGSASADYHPVLSGTTERG